MNWIVGELKPGDMIRVNRGLYYHYGIYIGDHKVIHFSGPKDDGINNPEDVLVREDSVYKFANNGSVEIGRCQFKEIFFKRNAKKIIQLAKASLNENGYNILKNNCEHFMYRVCFIKKMPTTIDNLNEEVQRKLGK